nr:efflux RND transporter periplasmic adaptor subunit [Lachnospiraceae bacterium]
CGKKEEGISALDKESIANTAVTVTVSEPVRKTLSSESVYIGTVTVDSTVTVLPMVSAEVTETNFDVGDHVSEGDLLFKLDDSSAVISLKQANAGESSAKAGLDAQKASNSLTHTSSADALNTQGTTRAQMQLQVDTARNNLTALRLQAGTATDSFYRAEKDLNEAYENKKKPEYKKILTNDVIEQMEEGKQAAWNAAQVAARQVESAEEALALAEQQLADYDNYTSGTFRESQNVQVKGADAQLESTKAGLTQAEAAVENAEMLLSYYTVEAPVSGTITAKNVSVHNMASPSQPAYIIESDEPARVVFYVAERSVRVMETGQELMLEQEGESYPGKIISVSNVLDPQTGLYKIDAQPDDPGKLPPSGSDVSVRTVSRRDRDALAVPGDSIYYDGEQAFLFIVEEGRAKRVNVTTGISQDGLISVDGINESDRVVTGWSSTLKDGTPVNEKAAGEE